MKSIYYNGKIISLIDKLFLELGDARSRIQNSESKIFDAYIASSSDGVPDEIKIKWNTVWKELNTENDLTDNKGREIRSSLFQTVQRKRNKTMEKYLLFFLEEYYRIIS